MKRMNYIRTGVLFVALGAAITAYSQQSTANPREISSNYSSQIDQINRQMSQDMVQGNFEKTLDFYTPDAISLPANEPMREGLDAIREGFHSMTSGGVKFSSYEPKTVKLIPEGNLITEIGTFKVSLTAGGQQIEDHGKYLTIWEKQPDGSLKIKVETWNSDVNPMESMPSGQGSSMPGQSGQSKSWPEPSDKTQSQPTQPVQPVMPGQTPPLPQ